MDFRAGLDTDCEALAVALRQRSIPKERRREARRVLQQIYVLRESERAEGGPDATRPLLALAREVDGLMTPLRAPAAQGLLPMQPLAFKVLDAWPIKIQGALRSEVADRILRTYTELGDRLDEIANWFWKRCDPEYDLTRTRTVQEKAMEEFGEDMEYVWGRRRRQ